MKRRKLLSGLFALSAATIVNGCHGYDKNTSDRDKDDDKNDKDKRQATLKVIIQGPFAVVLKKDEKQRLSVSAFIPSDPKHEFRFGTPMTKETDASKYRFTLERSGLDISEKRPYIDHGFDDMFFDLGRYPEPNYFVSIDLPVPDLITFIPPVEPVVFVDGRIVSAPLNHVLEYKISNLSQVILTADQLKEKKQRPMAFSEIYRQYENHHDNEQEYTGKKEHGPQFPHTRGELGRPAEPEVYTYFFGVGVAPNSMNLFQAALHGRDFFNNRLVPLFPNSKGLKPLSDIRNYGDPCTPVLPQGRAGEKPSVWRESAEQPRLLLVSSAEDCRAAGLMGCSGC